jgi:hypothetical protein
MALLLSHLLATGLLELTPGHLFCPQKRTTLSVNAALPLVSGKTTFAISNLGYSRNMIITVGENKLL